MIKRLVSLQSKTITGAAIVLAAASFVSRVIGVIRDRIFAHSFGAGDVLDVYYAAFRIPDIVYNLVIVGALSAGFIPIFLKAYTKNKKEAWEMTNSLIHILGLALILVCALLYIFTPQLMHLVVPGFDDEKLSQTVILTRIMFLSPLLLGLSAIVSGVLQSLKSFFVYSLTPIVYNLGIIFGTVALVPHFGIVGLAYGVIIGACFHLLIQIPTLFAHGYRYQCLLNVKNRYLIDIGKLMIPRILTLGTVQLNLLVITILASTLGTGSVSAFNFANNLQHFPIGLIGISFAVAAFPVFSKLFAEENQEAFISHIVTTVKQILFFILPLTLIFLLLRAQIVRILLGSGAFDWGDTIMTANALAFFSLSLFAQCLVPLLIRAFYAMHNTWIPLT
ncbi:murein biosynthesis integral membrane protein MurJ, partial [Candidatus Nomurabacteria bacterium]|nr:murein biosynthesis integral membrane protein MurJ [Candidatus Nomurabacteria bacterium]